MQMIQLSDLVGHKDLYQPCHAALEGRWIEGVLGIRRAELSSPFKVPGVVCIGRRHTRMTLGTSDF
ncbi:hypothetical protein GCM10023066_11980 [Nocardioides kongjuensis]